ncbi:MAG TPA: prenyltransferase/squalene oxidase repeat-containing protein [Pirellulales bacterium]|jgi:hypothetical protein|nr:prenyltransferase/squalene oxidase repeat-containing protein [Pirellulales bacterium]
MATADSDSSVREIAPGVSGIQPAASGSVRHSGVLWLDGEVLSCACPECGAPMSIRLWLRLADCWRCGTSVELTDEQHAQALRLLEARGEQPAAPVERWSQPVDRAAPAPPQAHGWPASTPHTSARQPAIRGLIKRDPWALGYALPSMLASVLAHMLLVIMLGLWVCQQPQRPLRLLLSATVSELNKPGEARLLDRIDTGTAFEAPELKPGEATAAFASLAERPLFDDPSPAAALPSGEMLAALGRSMPLPNLDTGAGNMLAGRSPHLRATILAKEGGTTETEAAVARGLKWLALHQDPGGHWSLERFAQAASCDCADPGGHSDTAATALALLPFLGAGQTHWQGEYTRAVARGLRALMDRQGSDGDLRGDGIGNMYAHGQATMALCEAYALSRDSLLRGPAQRAVDYIVAAQHRKGGWRYYPNQPGDTSVLGWQLMALRSGRMAGLNVPEETFSRAMVFLDSVQTERSRGLFSYMPQGEATETMTAEGLLSRQYAGWTNSNAALVNGVEWLRTKHPVNVRRPNMYYWYYATQVMHHFGGKNWDAWNADMRAALVKLQETRGHEAGSWTPHSGDDMRGGRVYMTALAVCTLEVYYRHLPLYRREATQAVDAK